MSLQDLLAQANAAAETAEDMNEAVKGGGGRVLPEGYAFGRFIEYIELGKHPQEYNGTAKEPALEVQIAFALWGQGYQNEDGTPYVIRPYRFAVSRNEKARSFKLFKALNWKGTAKTFAQLLGQTYLVKIVNKPKSAKDQTIVSRVDFDGFLPPLDPVTRAPYNIQDVQPDQYKLFLWDHPNKLGWDRLYVEGKYDDGNSKNSTQEYILSAVDYAGSALEGVLGGSGLALPAAPAIAPQAPAVAPVAPTHAPAPFVAPSAPASPSVPVGVVTPVSPMGSVPAVAPVPNVGGVGNVPLAPAAPIAPAVALPSLPAIPAVPSPVIPSAIPASLPTTFPSSPALPV